VDTAERVTEEALLHRSPLQQPDAHLGTFGREPGPLPTPAGEGRPQASRGPVALGTDREPGFRAQEPTLGGRLPLPHAAQERGVVEPREGVDQAGIELPA
jgi:hypothetical protein